MGLVGQGLELRTVIFNTTVVVDVGGFEDIFNQAICILQGCN